MNTAVGENVVRKEAWEKVTGKALYTDDLPSTGILHARLLASPHAHAKILGIDTAQALATEGVKAVLTGQDCALLFGLLLQDRPALAREKVRYAGEPVAMVVAREESAAEFAVRKIRVEYEPLPIVLSAGQSLSQSAPLLHDDPCGYKRVVSDIYPSARSNICSRYQIRKGDVQNELKACDVVVKRHYSLPPSDHAAMEVRVAQAEISADGVVSIVTSSQSPFAVRTQLAQTFGIQAGNIQVRVPFLGGGFGGKAPVFLEILAYLASRKVGGQAVRVTIPREQDMDLAPCRIGLEAEITLGADKTGKLRGAELRYWVDCGAYADSAPYMTKAIAVDCTGPYEISHLFCEAMCVYTNHTFATSYRGFGHDSYTFCIERTMDALARELCMDPLELRLKNAIHEGGETPAQVSATLSNVGDLPECIKELRTLAQWRGGLVENVKQNIVHAQGVACFWKSENPPTNAVSGALITCNPDGSFNLNTGVVEMGSGGQTQLAQIFAEKLKIDASQVHVAMDVDTRINPEHWKTVASMTAYMAGTAVANAADDIIGQCKHNGALIFECPESEIEVAHSRVYWRKQPERFIAFKDILAGYRTKDGQSIGEPVFGRGGFMFKGLSMLDEVSGKGQPGPSWTVGAQAVEVEVDTRELTYRILSATTVLDIGCAINPEAMRAMVAGGMAMGISLASREAFCYDERGILTKPTLRTYKLLHIGQEPDYRVGFVQTPEDGAPYGVRKYSEHGIIGMPAALGNALAAALNLNISSLPLTPERLWRQQQEKTE